MRTVSPYSRVLFETLIIIKIPQKIQAYMEFKGSFQFSKGSTTSYCPETEEFRKSLNYDTDKIH